MNVSDIKTRVKRQFGDESAVQITDSDIYRWITDAQKQIIIQNEGILPTASTTVSVAGQADYSLPSDLIVLKTILYKNFTLKKLTLQEFQEYIDGWQDSTAYSPGVPVNYMVYATTFTLFPAPQTAGESIKIYYSKAPLAIAADADPISLSTEYHEPIVMYCMQQAHELDEDWNASQIKKQQMETAVNLLRDRETYNEDRYYPTITRLPEDL